MKSLTSAGDNPGGVGLPDLGALADVPRLVFVGGRYRPDLSLPPDGVSALRFCRCGIVLPQADARRDR